MVTTPPHMRPLRPRVLRSKRARSRRGAAVFVVMLVIAGLSAAGLFAMRASLSSLDNAGRYRQMRQTQQLSDMGIQLAVAELDRDGQRYKTELQSTTSVTPGYPCRAASPARPQCVRVSRQQLAEIYESGGYEFFAPKSGTNAGALGFGDVTGNFGAEIVDVVAAGYAAGTSVGASTSTMRFYYFTVVSTGQVIPTGVGLGDSADAKFAASNLRSRAQVLVGPMF